MNRYTLLVIATWHPNSPGGTRLVKNIKADSKDAACEKVRARFAKHPGFVGSIKCRMTS